MRIQRSIWQIFTATTVVVVLALSGCASSGAMQQPLAIVGVAVARAAARVEIADQLRARHVSEESIAQTLSALSAITDDLMQGYGLASVLDARWRTVRPLAVDRISGVLASIRIDGVHVLDTVSARLIAESLVDAFAEVVRTAMNCKRAEDGVRCAQPVTQ